MIRSLLLLLITVIGLPGVAAAGHWSQGIYFSSEPISEKFRAQQRHTDSRSEYASKDQWSQGVYLRSDNGRPTTRAPPTPTYPVKPRSDGLGDFGVHALPASIERNGYVVAPETLSSSVGTVNGSLQRSYSSSQPPSALRGDNDATPPAIDHYQPRSENRDWSDVFYSPPVTAQPSRERDGRAVTRTNPWAGQASRRDEGHAPSIEALGYPAEGYDPYRESARKQRRSPAAAPPLAPYESSIYRPPSHDLGGYPYGYSGSDLYRYLGSDLYRYPGSELYWPGLYGTGLGGYPGTGALPLSTYGTPIW